MRRAAWVIALLWTADVAAGERLGIPGRPRAGAMLGGALFGGVGYDITPDVGVAARVSWSPPFVQLASREMHVVAAGLSLVLR